MQVTNEQEFEKLVEDYNHAKLDFDELPSLKPVPGVKFNNELYKRVETARVKLDLALAKIFLAKPSIADFLTVEKDGSVVQMTYNPFGKYLDNLAGMTFDDVIVPDKKKRVYSTASNGSIIWLIRKMTGDINLLFDFKLGKWFSELDIDKDVDGFCKDVQILIRYYPHVELPANIDYAAALCLWIKQFDVGDVMEMEILKGIQEKLKVCIYADKVKEYERKGTLKDEIYHFQISMAMSDCSKKCHEAFKNLHIGSQKNRNLLDRIEARGMQKKEARQALLKNKRKIEDGGKNAGGVPKKARVEVEAPDADGDSNAPDADGDSNAPDVEGELDQQ